MKADFRILDRARPVPITVIAPLTWFAAPLTAD
jgi:hypothetical protein